MELRLEELREKEVIGITDGRRFGYVGDVVIDLDSGLVRQLVVPGPARFFGLFGRGEDVAFSWDSVSRFGTDLILVEGEPIPLGRRRKERRKWF
jgi:YlmC/YmxH family sporulation protein